LPLVVFGFFINRTLYLNPKLSTSLYPSGGLLDRPRDDDYDDINLRPTWT
jgi:hypothetical protein